MDTVGLFFGSFNPVHNGHLAIACSILQQGYCREIRLMVSPRNPWKTGVALLDESKRLEIVREAVKDYPDLKASDFEFALPRPSYTYQTLQALKAHCPEKRFVLIIGGDNWLRFPLWKDHEKILEEFPVLVYPRPGLKLPPFRNDAVTFVDAPLLDISSTEIRQKIACGEDISSDVPASALPLILKYYGGE